jgi:predicted peptidase
MDAERAVRSRKEFLVVGAGIGAAAIVAGAVPAYGQIESGHVVGVTAVTQVFGDGPKLIAVAVEYDRAIDGARIPTASYTVDTRTVTSVFTSRSADPAGRAAQGRYVIVMLSPDDADASLKEGGAQAEASGSPRPQGGHRRGGSWSMGGTGGGWSGGGRGGPGGQSQGGAPSGSDASPGAWDDPAWQGSSAYYKPAEATITQVLALKTADGKRYSTTGLAMTTSRVKNLIVDDFRQYQFNDPKTGDSLAYNLFVPKNYDKSKAYPLVLFMHDAGSNGTDPLTTLHQGLGAVIWASPQDQAKHPCFVLAPQYSDPVFTNKGEPTSILDTTVNLVNQLAGVYHIDRSRLYATGQGEGGMLALAADVKYPNIFAASFVVASAWNADKAKPLATQKIWLVVSEGDKRTYTGANALADALQKDGANVNRAAWDGSSTASQFAADVMQMEGQNATINYVTLQKPAIVPLNQAKHAAGDRERTWQIAYTIDGIRDWMFQQRA